MAVPAPPHHCKAHILSSPSRPKGQPPPACLAPRWEIRGPQDPPGREGWPGPASPSFWRPPPPLSLLRRHRSFTQDRAGSGAGCAVSGTMRLPTHQRSSQQAFPAIGPQRLSGAASPCPGPPGPSVSSLFAARQAPEDLLHRQEEQVLSPGFLPAAQRWASREEWGSGPERWGADHRQGRHPHLHDELRPGLPDHF